MKSSAGKDVFKILSKYLMNKHLQLNAPILKFIEKIQQIDQAGQPKPSEKIKVSYVASSLSFLYEKIRNTVDYKDEYLLRKYAIERILNRLIFIEGRKGKLGEPLLTDLIRGRYFPNDSIDINKISEIDEIIRKYLVLLEKTNFKGQKEKNIQKLNSWLVGIASYEIEKKLVPFKKEEALIEFVYNSVKKDIQIKGDLLTERERIVQIYLAIMRALFKSDLSMLSYYLLKVYWPDWFGAKWNIVVGELGENLFTVKNSIESEINHPVADKLFRFFKRRMVAYLIIFDLLSQDPAKMEEKIVSSKIAFLEDVRTACKKRYGKAKETLSRTFKRSVLYIFLTKIVLAFIIEVPYELMTMAGINYVSLGINVVFHPTLMYFLGSTIKMPGDKNTAQVIREAEYVVYQRRASDIPPYPVKFNFTKPSISSGLYAVFYAVMFAVSFGLIITVLRKIDFNIVSGALFTFFLSVVSFFAFKISQPVRELVVIDKKDNVFEVIADFLFLPVIYFGRWLSERFSQVNIFVFALDFIIEVPFKSFIKIFDDWIKFIREKKDEMV